MTHWRHNCVHNGIFDTLVQEGGARVDRGEQLYPTRGNFGASVQGDNDLRPRLDGALTDIPIAIVKLVDEFTLDQYGLMHRLSNTIPLSFLVDTSITSWSGETNLARVKPMERDLDVDQLMCEIKNNTCLGLFRQLTTLMLPWSMRLETR